MGERLLLSWLKLTAGLVLVTVVCELGAHLRPLPLDGSLARPEQSGSSSGTSRNWKQAPAIVELDTAGDVYTVGDVHGDYNRLVSLLAAGKVIDGVPDHPKQVRWSAGQSVLICTGDLIDKGRHSLKVIALFRALEKDAAKAGGRVILGVHESHLVVEALDPTLPEKESPDQGSAERLNF
jgi:hypothetical protein